MGNSGNTEVFIRRARESQAHLSKRLSTKNMLPDRIRLVAGVDAAYFGGLAFGAAVVFDYESMRGMEAQTAVRRVCFPYIPTLFSFRELPIVAAAIGKLTLQPDIILVDAHGRAHPLRFGFASHLGVVLGKPTIGVAKRRLVGEKKLVGQETLLLDRGEVIGAVVATKQGAKPVYVSGGHMISLETAVEVVRHCTRNNRLPEPIRAAHELAVQERKAQIAPFQQLY